MRSSADFRSPQKLAYRFMLKTPKGAVWADMGVGKTGAAILYICYLIYRFKSSGVLVVAPLSVTLKTWPDELGEWSEAQGLRVINFRDITPSGNLVHEAAIKRMKYWDRKLEKLQSLYDSMKEKAGEKPAARDRARLSIKKREISIAKNAIKWGKISGEKYADVYLINRENVVWLVHFWGKYWPYDSVIFDESSGLRNGMKTIRWRAMRKVMPHTENFLELTGTPAPKGYEGIWAQIYLLDGGERLGRTKTAFLQRFFYPDQHRVDKYILKPGAKEAILDAIKDIVLVLRAEDFMDLPETIYAVKPVFMTDAEKRKYKQMEKTTVLEMYDGNKVKAVNSSAMRTKLRQLANGFIYDRDKKPYSIHDAKLDALEQFIEERQGNPFILAYWYEEDREAIVRRFPQVVIRDKKGTHDEAWSKGNVEIYMLHPASNAHGLNIQKGSRTILWYSIIDDLEIYLQLNGRLNGARSVGLGTTFIHHLITQGTIEERMYRDLIKKDYDQNDMKAFLLELINGYCP